MAVNKFIIRSFLSCSIFMTFLAQTASASIGEFDQSNPQIDLNLLKATGADKDAQAAIDQPEYVKADKISYIRDDEMIVGVVIGNEERAYPVKILNWHEVINAEYIGQSLKVYYAVTWSPLTNTPIVFDRTVFAEVLEFGVSGLLLNNNLVLYDKTYQGLWSQMLAKGLSGPLSYHRLDILPSEYTTWGQWKKAHPNTRAITLKTGYWKDYNKDPYQRYRHQQKILYPVEHQDKKYFNKRIGLGVSFEGIHKLYFLDRLEKIKDQPALDKIGEVEVKIEKTPAGSWQVFRIDDLPENANRYIASFPVYWFAWKAFFPDTEVYEHRGLDLNFFKEMPFFQ
ncbi:MAG: DUF3179 domain-containing protein [Candidatus Omnitrophica bacterium]|nr:DUF3179 domain-containing protein [Candidatus Omnitrophota bacterium]